MFNEYLTDIGILCLKGGLTESEKDAVISFAKDNCDTMRTKVEDDELLQSAFRKLKSNNLYTKLFECIKTPKSFNTDFDGENGIPF